MLDGCEILVCVYYRVGRSDCERAIAAVRDFQRTLSAGSLEAGVVGREVLVRYETSDTPSPSDVLPDLSLPCESSSAIDASIDTPGDATVMETYRLALPARAPEPGARAALHAFLAALATASAPLAPLLRGARHIELFSPCAS